ncbi:hypothetical protein ABFS82_10G010900 [Erythranthe guttata]|uniref:protein trichome birefringence-like 34 n=1 Tax=Erythranthe guttata TaxID=4155 RepID=UPI00064DD824|nr:PREDICTED: protein trichome birefringence-like 34 [Erythranthe guttata]|eukprot:XP_012832212.1 PREDICTED: protein trichome birefringence-like 34 [Erythranthe guttata]
MKLGKWDIRIKSHYFAGLVVMVLFTAALFLTGRNNDVVLVEEIARNVDRKTGPSCNDSVFRCNLFSGKWVFDGVSNTLYEEKKCSFMTNEFACEKYGRKEFKYQKWRWQPHQCDLPRFNGSSFMEKIRGKRVVFVGDSLIRNQWISMLCMIESSLHPSSSKAVVQIDNLFVFQSIEYNATIEFYWSPLLVESNCDDPYSHRIKDRTVRIKSIEKHARHWTDADILIFNSFMWWLEPNMTILWGSFGSSDAIYKRVETNLRLYEMALNTWSEWLEININRTKTKLFFMSLSPYHFQGESLNEGHCYNVTEPIMKEDYWGISTDIDMMRTAESTIQKLEKRGLKAEYLNITHLSDYRRDAHTSIYRKFGDLSDDQLSNPKSYSDCVHWCLPGVPDVWNQIFYSYIINSS